MEVVGGGYEEREEDIGAEGGDGIHQEGERAYSSAGFVEGVEFRRGHVRIRFQKRLDVNVGYVGGGVEELREETNPSKEFYFTDLAGQRRKVLD